MQRTPDSINNVVNLLQPGEEAAIPIIIYFNFDPVNAEDIEIHAGLDDLFRYSIKPSAMSKYKNFDIVLAIKYCDMFDNEFSQKVILCSYMHMEIAKDGKASHLCDINLKETTLPKKMKKCKY